VQALHPVPDDVTGSLRTAALSPRSFPVPRLPRHATIRKGALHMSDNSPTRRPLALGALVGLVAALAMTLVQALLRLGLGVPSPAELIGDRLGERVPVKPFLNLIGRIGSYGRLKALSVFGVLAVTLVLGAVVGALYARITERRPADPGHPLGRLGLSRRGLSVLAAVVAVGRIVSIAVFWPLLASYYRGAPRGTARQCRLAALRLRRFRRHPDRRLRAAHQQAGGRGGAQRGDAARRTPGRPGRRCRPRAGRGDGRSPPQLHTRSTFGYDGLQNKGDLAAITPNDRFYVVTQNLIDPQVHKGSWQLEIGGAVDRPRQYDLGAGFPWSVVHGRAG